ncbi:MAG: DASH family cryptochrome [Pseudomonadales bacterium]|nr:DASH family cryptochrome [Pseudomonadales bacterium]
MIFRNNLRLQHNAALQSIKSKVDYLDCVFVIEPTWLANANVGRSSFRDCYSGGMGEHRRRFLIECLLDLDQQLRQRGSLLGVHFGEFSEVIERLILTHDYDVIALVDLPGANEQQQTQRLLRRFPLKQWLIADDFYLMDRADQRLGSLEYPQSFSKFRRLLDGMKIEPPKELLGRLPPPSIWAEICLKKLARENVEEAHSHSGASLQRLQGGENAALEQLNYYLHERGLIRTYKKTRNGLDGWEFSSKMSGWLAQGCLSVRTLFYEIQRHEDRYGDNESTYWLRFELWWREYFQWLARNAGPRLFSLRGIKRVNPLLTFYPEAFMAWREGHTQCDFVNAFMKQLRATGWMSNRGRQIVASYLINELGVDWRYGAAYFEQQLIDYDCASNWGNWQYLAGVGTDPRGRRRFSMEKQKDVYDPNGEFTKAWLEEDSSYERSSFL